MANITKKENGHQPATFGSVIDQVFQNNLSRFFDDSFWGFTQLNERSQPPVNIRETENSYDLEMVLPGIRKEKIKLETTNDLLTVSYADEEDKQDNNGYIQRQFRQQSFSKSFRLNDMIDTGNITARYEDGLLRLQLPKNEKSGRISRNIAIQ